VWGDSLYVSRSGYETSSKEQARAKPLEPSFFKGTRKIKAGRINLPAFFVLAPREPCLDSGYSSIIVITKFGIAYSRFYIINYLPMVKRRE
jgi:hypothetical protein